MPLKLVFVKIFVLLIFIIVCWPVTTQAYEPIRPIPQQVEYDHKKALLGKRLFFETLLSKDNSVSCHTCHDFKSGGSEPRPVSIGVYERKGNMNAPTVLNSYFNFRQFWNGRAADLKEQASGPLHSMKEMDMTVARVEDVLNSHPEYPKIFKKVYQTSVIKFDMVVDAIAEFEKALFTPDSRFDQYLRGEINLSENEKQGYRLFKTFGCVSCHNGINIGGNSYQYVGAVNPLEEELSGDLYEISGDPFDKNRFKVPSLRNIALTAPYLHDGSRENLAEMLKLMAYHNLGFNLSTEEISLLTSFLNTLTGKTPKILQHD